MEAFTIEVERRTETGSAGSNRIRRAGRIPAIVYSRGEQSLPLSFGYNDFMKLAKRARSSQIFALKSGDKDLDGRSVVVKEIQQNYVSGQVLHVDFQSLHASEEITVGIQIKFNGEAVGVKIEGGILTVSLRELMVTCVPSLIPEFVEVDISELGIGDGISAGEIELPEGVSLDGSPGESVVSVVAARKEEESEEAEAAAEGEEGAAAAAEKGAETEKEDAKE